MSNLPVYKCVRVGPVRVVRTKDDILIVANDIISALEFEDAETIIAGIPDDGKQVAVIVEVKDDGSIERSEQVILSARSAQYLVPPHCSNEEKLKYGKILMSIPLIGIFFAVNHWLGKENNGGNT